MAAYEKDIAHYAEFIKAAESPMLQPIDFEKSQLGDIPALKVTVHMPKLPEGPGAAMQEQMMKAIMGKDGKLDAWIVPADEHHVVMGYVSKENILKTVEAIKKGEAGFADDASIAKTAALLPKDALSVGYLSPQGLVDFGKRAAALFLPPQVPVEQLVPDFPQTPPIGLAVTAPPHELQTVLVVPNEVIKAIGEYVEKVKKQHGAM
jgi:hypothetical protein